MIGALSVMASQPCLISVMSDGDGPDLVIVEPLKVVDVFGVNGKNVVHADLNTETEGRNHVSQ